MPRDLVLVRHGESEGNLALREARAGRHEAYSERFRARPTERWRLTDQGVEQAKAAGQWLRERFDHFDRYYVSEYHRAKETAAYLGYEDARWFQDYRLREREWGLFDRMPLNERERDYEQVMLMQAEEPFYWKPPDGESLAALAMRLDRVLGSLHREVSTGRAILVCHGEVMWTLRVMLERMSQDRFRALHLDRDPSAKIGNCQILHYTRVDPHTGQESPYYTAMRSVCPWRDTESEWHKIERVTYSNEDLLAEVGATERIYGSAADIS
jgi:NAD+ kinase